MNRKKKSENYFKSFRMPRLFREQIEEIEEIIVNELKPRGIKIETEGYEYPSLKDLPSNIKRSNDLTIQVIDPYLSITFSKNRSNLFCSDNSQGLSTLGAISKIEAIIKSCERKILFNFFHPISWMVINGLICSVLLVKGKISVFSSLQTHLMLSALFLSYIILLISLYISTKYFSKICFTCRSEMPSFFSRNKDQLIVNILVAVISVFLTLAASRFFTDLTPPSAS